MNCGTSLITLPLASDSSSLSESAEKNCTETVVYSQENTGFFRPEGTFFTGLSILVWTLSALCFAGMAWLLAYEAAAFRSMWWSYAALSGICLVLSITLPLSIPWSRTIPYRFLAGMGFMAFGLDQVTKWMSVAWLRGNPAVKIIDNLFSLTYVQNRGAAFGLFQGYTTLFIIMAGVTAVVIFLYFQLTAADEYSVQLALILILSGAIGNLIDRILLGYVIDFLAVYRGSWNWPVFNVADMMIDIGVGLIVLDIIRDIFSPSPEDDAQPAVPA